MRVELLESRKKVSRSVWHAGFSVWLHLIVVGAVLQATAGAVTARPPSLSETTLVYVPPPSRSPMPARSQPQSESAMPSIPVAPDLPPVVVPKGLPAISLNGPAPSTGFSTAEPQGWSRTFPPTKSDSTSPTYALEQVDEPVVLLRQPDLHYPAGLQRLGVAGRVLVQFVVDTLGRVEPASWDPVEATHPQFERAAFQALAGARFRPARMGGRPVRQLVRQSIRFDLP